MSNADSTFKNIGLIAPDVLLPKNSTNMYKWVDTESTAMV